MLHVETSVIIHASSLTVQAIYRDYRAWPRIFPTIHAVHVLAEVAGRAVLEIDHREGHVVNVLTDVSPDTIELKEWKRRYTATFRNRFQAYPGGTRYSLSADIEPNGLFQLLTPFARGYIRRQMVRLVLEPVRVAAERGVIVNQGNERVEPSGTHVR